jgi:hypothetical protein
MASVYLFVDVIGVRGRIEKGGRLLPQTIPHPFHDKTVKGWATRTCACPDDIEWRGGAPGEGWGTRSVMSSEVASRVGHPEEGGLPGGGMGHPEDGGAPGGGWGTRCLMGD